MRPDVKWYPLDLSKDTRGDDKSDTKAQELQPGVRCVLAVKINSIEATLCSGSEAHVRATLRCAADGVFGSSTGPCKQLSFRVYSHC